MYVCVCVGGGGGVEGAISLFSESISLFSEGLLAGMKCGCANAVCNFG